MGNVKTAIYNVQTSTDSSCSNYSVPSDNLSGRCGEGAIHQQLWGDYVNAGKGSNPRISQDCKNKIDGSTSPSTDVAEDVRDSYPTAQQYQILKN